MNTLFVKNCYRLINRRYFISGYEGKWGFGILTSLKKINTIFNNIGITLNSITTSNKKDSIHIIIRRKKDKSLYIRIKITISAGCVIYKIPISEKNMNLLIMTLSDKFISIYDIYNNVYSPIKASLVV